MKSRKSESSAKKSTASSSAGSAKAGGGSAKTGGGGRGNAFRAEQIKKKKTAGAKSDGFVSPEDVGVSAGPSQDDRYYGKESGWVPSAAETLQTDHKARIIWLSVKDSVGGLEVKIAAGFNQGLYEDMELTICTAKGRPMVDTTVYNVQDRLSTAMLIPEVGRITPDMISAEGGNIILRPR